MKSEAAAASSKRAPADIEDVIEAMGLGWGQMLGIVLASGTFLLEGLEVVMVCLLQPLMVEEVRNFEMGFVTMLTSLGAVLGVLIGSALAEACGRPAVILWSYILASVAIGITTLVTTATSVAILLLCLGLSMGLAQPSALALMHECSPRPWRFFGLTFAMLLYGVGALLAVSAVTFYETRLLSDEGFGYWRTLLWYSTFTSIFFLAGSFFFLWESPSFLAKKGQMALAKDTLAFFQFSAMTAEDHEQSLENIDNLVSPRATALGWQGIVQAKDALLHYLSSFQVLIFCSFTVSFAAYSCAYCSLVIVDTDAEAEPWRGTAQAQHAYWHRLFIYALLLGASCVVIFLVLSNFCLRLWQHKSTLCMCLAVTMALSVALAGLGAAQPRSAAVSTAWGDTARGVAFVVSLAASITPAVGLLLVLCTALELSPLEGRTAVAALCLALSRLGTVAAMFVNRWLLTTSDLHWIALLLSIALCCTSWLAVRGIAAADCPDALPQPSKALSSG
eukprot:CAMPEP_0178408948 /NCGR_PEP_ID=MMETSP0689_2-20121128/20206_1 /TAXON_ID=160604 /ORGANISM="Amphidinium massartii, Strain CS-259" /LENGTH=504 /DNA_ID=CAMNT_0020030067 /DNA_START=124 /DNA_END=1635 /DNA_ORIENTATION=+